MLETKHHWLPVILAAYLPISIFITYSMAVAYGHVEAGFPYISDTGTKSPESCVFGQLLNIGAVLAGIIVYVKYRHTIIHFENVPQARTVLRLNTAAFVIGTLTVFGVSLVGNFQETNVLVVHLIGALMAFGVGFIYMVLQTIISFKSSSIENDIPGNTLYIRKLRVALCLVDICLLLLLGICSRVARSKGPGEGKSKLHWSANDPGYAEHVVATVSEWLVAFVTIGYFATFYTEFKHFRMKPPEAVYYNQEVPTNETTRMSTSFKNYSTFSEK